MALANISWARNTGPAPCSNESSSWRETILDRNSWDLEWRRDEHRCVTNHWSPHFIEVRIDFCLKFPSFHFGKLKDSRECYYNTGEFNYFVKKGRFKWKDAYFGSGGPSARGFIESLHSERNTKKASFCKMWQKRAPFCGSCRASPSWHNWRRQVTIQKRNALMGTILSLYLSNLYTFS